MAICGGKLHYVVLGVQLCCGLVYHIGGCRDCCGVYFGVEERTLKKAKSRFREIDEQIGKQLGEEAEKFLNSKNIFGTKHLSIAEINKELDVVQPRATLRYNIRKYWTLQKLKSEIKREIRKRGF